MNQPQWRGVIEGYTGFLPVGPDEQVVMLSEGNTPLVRPDRLAADVAPGTEP